MAAIFLPSPPVKHIVPWRCLPAPTCMTTLPLAYLLQDARSAQGYWDSVIRENDEHNNETFTYRLKLLKRNVRQAVRSVDVACMGNRGMAMAAEKLCGSKYCTCIAPCHLVAPHSVQHLPVSDLPGCSNALAVCICLQAGTEDGAAIAVVCRSDWRVNCSNSHGGGVRHHRVCTARHERFVHHVHHAASYVPEAGAG
jgi:hypothetical protein